MQNISLLEQQAGQIRNDRGLLFDALLNIKGVEAWPSEANFILFRVPEKGAEYVHAELLKHKVLIKKLHGVHPLLENCLRVTIGTKEENKAFLSALDSAVRE